MANIWNALARSENYEVEQAERQAWFAKIAPEGNWKLAIDAWIGASAGELYNCAEACRFFTGSELEVVGVWQGKLHVKAAGYYAAIGA